MDEQLFTLSGENWDLQELAFSFRDGPATVKKIEDVFYLCLEMETGRSEEEIHAAGETTLKQINGIRLARNEGFRPLKICGITRLDPITGKIETCVKYQGPAELRARGRGTLTVGESDGTENKGPTEDQTALRLAGKCEPLRRTQIFYGSLKQHDWVNLYKVLEAMEDGNGGEAGLVAKHFVPHGEIKKFKETAQIYRHGSNAKGTAKPKMTWEQAQAMFRKLFQGWTQELKDRDGE
jgi:hypothetical protein